MKRLNEEQHLLNYTPKRFRNSVSVSVCRVSPGDGHSKLLTTSDFRCAYKEDTEGQGLFLVRSKHQRVWERKRSKATAFLCLLWVTKNEVIQKSHGLPYLEFYIPSPKE